MQREPVAIGFRGAPGDRAALILPVLWLLCIFFYPLASTIIQALSNSTGEGVRPLATAAADPLIQKSLFRTIAFTTIVVPVELLLGTIWGWCINLLGRRRLAQLLWLLAATPMLLPSVVIGLMWRNLLDPLRGIFPFLSQYLFGYGLSAFSSPRTAFIALCITDIWQWTSLVTVVTAAVLAQAPREEIEQASLDGFSKGAMFRALLWPMLKTTLWILALLRIIDSLRTFDLVYILTQGGPGTATELLSFLIYQTGFSYLDESGAAGISVILLFLSSFVLGLFLFLGKREHVRG